MKEYLASAEDVLKEQSTSADAGLSTAEAQTRQAKFGPNKLKEEEKTPLWIRFFQQMADPMVIMLIVAAAISAITGTIQGESEWADVIIILAVVIINSVLGVVQEAKSEQALEALLSLGLVDSYRLFAQPERTYSWWDYRRKAFEENKGVRIDLLLVSEALRASVRAAGIDAAPRALAQPSDHAPVWVKVQA